MLAFLSLSLSWSEVCFFSLLLSGSAGLSFSFSGKFEAKAFSLSDELDGASFFSEDDNEFFSFASFFSDDKEE